MAKHSRYEDQGYIYKHVLNGGAIVADIRDGNLIISPYVDRFGISLWLVPNDVNRDAKVTLFNGKSKTDAVYAARLFYHLAFPGTYQLYDQKGQVDVINVSGIRLSEPKKRKPLPITVERYYNEHLSQGLSESQSMALAWSRYCKYSYPGSKRCQRKPSQYLTGR